VEWVSNTIVGACLERSKAIFLAVGGEDDDWNSIQQNILAKASANFDALGFRSSRIDYYERRSIPMSFVNGGSW
jgi:hypothetical protein